MPDAPDTLHENLEILAGNDKVIDEKLSRLEASLKEALTPKEVKEQAAKQRNVTYEDLEKNKAETAKETAALLEHRETVKAAEREADEVYTNTLKTYKEAIEEKGINWKNSYTKSYDSFAKEALSQEIMASKKEGRAFDWDNVTSAIDADMKDLLGLEEVEEEATEEKTIKKPELKAKSSQALTGLSEDMANEFTKPSGIEKLEKALKDGTLSYDEKFRLYEELMDYKHSIAKPKRGLNVSSR